MSRWSSPPRLTFARVSLACALLGSTAGCAERRERPDDPPANPRDQDRGRRPAWVHEQALAEKTPLRETLTNTAHYEFAEGFYPVEADPKTGGAWRWMGRRGVLRIRTRTWELGAAGMSLRLFGWVPHEHLGLLTSRLEVSVNGHVLERFEPPKESFERAIFVPRWLLEKSDWVDVVIRAANYAQPGGDWRELGFATTGFHWTPVAVN